MPIEVSIAVNSYRSPELLRLGLQAIRRELTGAAFTYEVLVVDSATEEDTEMLLREEFPEVRFFPHAENVGFGRLINTSIQESVGRYMFFINADIILRPDTLSTLLAYARTHPNVGLIGPKQLNFNGSLQSTCLRFYRPMTILYRRTWLKHLPFGQRHLDWFTMSDFDHISERDVDWIMGSALFVSREAAEAVGPMDSRFFMYMEDVDWCRRFWEHGFRVVYVPTASVYHYHAKGSAKGGFFRSLLGNRLTWYHIESALRYFYKYRGKPLPIHS
ncbi:MAG: glycosyltransferase family 2 protein [Candidatus Moraniibacteriota bacterium]